MDIPSPGMIRNSGAILNKRSVRQAGEEVASSALYT